MSENTPARRVIDPAILDDMTSIDVETILAVINGEVDLAETDAESISDEIVRNILAAETLDDILGDQEGVKGTADYVGQVITIKDFSIRPSNVGGGEGLYFLVNVRHKDTDELMSTSSKNVMAQLAALKWRGLLPVPVTVKADETRGGNTVFRLALAVQL